jgi:competence protein ComEA
MTKTVEKCDVASVADHAGGLSPGVAGTAPTRGWSRVRTSTWYPLLKKVVSVSAGMIGLSVIGLVAGAPERERLDLMGVSGDLGGTWLAGAEAHSAEASGSVQAREEPTALAPGADVTPAAASGSATSPSPPGSATATAPQGGITADGKVILNLATLDELTRLPGIGQKRAEKIVQLRERLGRFKKPTDLLRIKGIGPKSLRKMLPHLVLDPPTAG